MPGDGVHLVAEYVAPGDGEGEADEGDEEQQVEEGALRCMILYIYIYR